MRKVESFKLGSSPQRESLAMIIDMNFQPSNRQKDAAILIFPSYFLEIRLVNNSAYLRARSLMIREFINRKSLVQLIPFLELNIILYVTMINVEITNAITTLFLIDYSSFFLYMMSITIIACLLILVIGNYLPSSYLVSFRVICKCRIHFIYYKFNQNILTVLIIYIMEIKLRRLSHNPELKKLPILTNNSRAQGPLPLTIQGNLNNDQSSSAFMLQEYSLD